jgi:hypothetical protein
MHIIATKPARNPSTSLGTGWARGEIYSPTLLPNSSGTVFNLTANATEPLGMVSTRVGSRLQGCGRVATRMVTAKTVRGRVVCVSATAKHFAGRLCVSRQAPNILQDGCVCLGNCQTFRRTVVCVSASAKTFCRTVVCVSASAKHFAGRLPH